jgi:ribonuclease J
MSGDLKLVFLGGVGEIGMNCLAIEAPDGIVIVDCGVMFPPGGYFGPDYIIPDLRYFEKNMERIQAVVVTHGHEDHIGAIPAIFADTHVTVYAPAFAAGLLREKVLEYPGPPNLKLKRVGPGHKVNVAGLEFTFIRVTHSIPDALALAIKTPFGTIVHSGDFRFDLKPSLGQGFDAEAFRQLGDEGVLLLLSDSTNAERAGSTRQETEVAAEMEKLIAGHKGRVVVSMFSSNIERVRLFARLAQQKGRKLALLGRSLNNYSRIAIETGYAPFDPNMLVAPERISDVPPRKLMVLIAGSQGEPRSALTRAAIGEHGQISIGPTDMVIYSSKMIPGNEKDIQRVINSLVRCGSTVYHEGNSNVHTSGHACRDELAEFLRLVRPRYFIPVHGEYRFLASHAKLAAETVETVPVVADLGDIISVSEDRVEWSGSMDVEPHFIEGPLVGSAHMLKLRERRRLMYNGLVLVQCTVRRKKRRIVVTPTVQLFGIPDPDGYMVPNLEDVISETLGERWDQPTVDEIEEAIRVVVRRHVKKMQAKKPEVHMIIQEVLPKRSER